MPDVTTTTLDAFQPDMVDPSRETAGRPAASVPTAAAEAPPSPDSGPPAMRRADGAAGLVADASSTEGEAAPSAGPSAAGVVAADGPDASAPASPPAPVRRLTDRVFPHRPGWFVAIVALLVVMPVAPLVLWQFVYVRHIYNFHVVPTVSPKGGPELLRCGQMSEAGLEAAIRVHGVKTVINLRWGNEDPSVGADATEKEVCDRNGVRYVFMPVADVVEQHTVPITRRDGSGTRMMVPWCVAQFLDIMDDPANHPVMLHCRVGKHRTGILTAVWQLERAPAGTDLREHRRRVLSEMIDCGFLLEDRVTYWPERTFVETYQPRHVPVPDLLYPYLDRTVPGDARRLPGGFAPVLGTSREQGEFDEREPARLSKDRQ